MADSGIYRCTSSFSFDRPGGVAVIVNPGAVVTSDDDRYRGHEAHFEPVESSVTRSVEQTTSAPGERRALSRPKPAGTEK
jgi:hypothetical protein